MAAIDVAGFVADLKDHAVTHGFHVHDERHFVETYSLRQAWEVDLHPEDGCGGRSTCTSNSTSIQGPCSPLKTPSSGCPTTSTRPTNFTFSRSHLEPAAHAPRP